MTTERDTSGASGPAARGIRDAARLDRGSGAALALLTLAVLLAFRALYQSADSLGYALAASSGERMFHPHHLLFAPLVRGVWLVLLPIGADGVLAGQVHNALWACVAVVATWAGVKQLCGRRSLAWAAGLGLLACQGFLFHATQVETYVPAAACSALLVLLLVRDEAGSRPAPPAGLAAVLALAVFYHQTSVLLVVPLAVYGWIRGDTRLRSALLRGVLVAGGLVLAGYGLAYLSRASQPTLAGFLEFCLQYAVADKAAWGDVGNVSPAGFASLADQQLWNFVQIRDDARVARIVVMGLFVSALAWNTVELGRSGQRRALRAFFLTWLGVHMAFFLWWLPTDREFFTVSLLPWIWLVTLGLDDALLRRPGSRALAWLVWGMAAVSGAGLLPYHVQQTLLPASRSRGPAYAGASALARAAPEDCVLLTSHPVRRTLRYYDLYDPKRVLGATRWKQELEYSPDPPELPPLEGRSCVVVAWSMLRPGEGEKGSPEGAWRFLHWALRIEASSDAFSLPPLRALRGGVGDVYVQSGPGPAVSVTPEALFLQLDELGARAAPGPFVRWWRRSAPRLAETGEGR